MWTKRIGRKDPSQLMEQNRFLNAQLLTEGRISVCDVIREYFMKMTHKEWKGCV